MEAMPAALASDDPRNKSDLPGHGHEHGLEIRQLGFHLDEKKGSSLRVPRDEVNGTALSEFVEGELSLDYPPRGSNDAGDVVDDCCVLPIDEAIDGPAAPASLHDQLDPERSTYAPCGRKGYGLEATRLEIRDHRLIAMCEPPDVRLTQALFDPNGTDDPSDAHIAHSPIVADDSHLAITR